MLTNSLPTGVTGLDEILGGGYPTKKMSLLRGSSGCGKTIYSMLFACANTSKNKPSVYVTFDESPDSLKNYINCFNLNSNIHILDFRPEPELTMTGGELELGGMLVRIENAIKKTGSKCLVLDAIDVLLSVFEQKSRVITELHRVFEWCHEHDLTLLMTSGEDADYQKGRDVLDYLCDCNVNIEQKTDRDMMTRMLQVVKCRGRKHWTNAYPFLIDSTGITIMPVTGLSLSAKVSSKKASTGIKELDKMLGGKGLWSASTCMVTGASGSGKSLLAMNLLHAACKRKEKSIYFSFEESPDQIIRNVASINLDVSSFVKSGMLKIESMSAVEQSMEEHILRIIRSILTFKPKLVIIDPITSLGDIGNPRDVKNTVIKLCNLIKQEKIMLVLTELIPDDAQHESSLHISSLIDTWIRLKNVAMDGELNRMIYIQKSRGAGISKQIREFIISNRGLNIEKPYIGSGGMLFGSAKKQKILVDELNKKAIRSEIAKLNKELKTRKDAKGKQLDEINLKNFTEICRLEQRIASLENSLKHAELLSAQKELLRD